MEQILRKREEILRKYRDIHSLQGEAFREELIKITKESMDIEEELKSATINEISLTEHELFISRKELIISFWTEIWQKTKGSAKINTSDAVVIPSKLLLMSQQIERLFGKEKLTKEEVHELINIYRTFFELVLKILQPYFENISNKKYSDWSTVYKEIKTLNQNYSKLFSSMNGTLRNAVAHESTYLEENKFIWIKEDGTETEYSLEKVENKILNLFFLVLLLYWGLNKVYIQNLIKEYKKVPSNLLKKGYLQANL